MKDVMIDLETFGSGPDACTIQIGACYFDRKTGAIGEKLELNVDAVTTTGKLDASTLYWWLQQSKAAIDGVTKEPRLSEKDAYAKLNLFLKDAEAVWSHATFDFVIVTNTLKRLGIKPLFSYRSARDIRTLVNLARVDTKALPRDDIQHTALADCLYQVKYCVSALNVLLSEKRV